MKAPPPRRLGDISREAYIFLGAGAAVLLQMAQPGVGLGVAEHSATLQRPLDRLRTTMTYIYALTLGTEEERRAIAALVNRAHKPVRSDRYSAFDPRLQLWVAATLYRGGAVLTDLFHGPLAAEDAEALYREAAVYGTALQMPPSAWPADRAAFERYWSDMLQNLQVEEPVRRYVHALLDGGAVPWWLRFLMPLQRFATRGLLPAQVRAAYGLPWTEADQRRWDRFCLWAPRLYRWTPGFLRHLPARLVLAGMRRRMAGHRRVI
ncbi:MAG TPA: oxygenase MpaB family protein [Ramlibacter sp.]|nr:oxygenase MpaB family protein [Ramlibacter sp.]